SRADKSDNRGRVLLRARRERPRRCAAEQRDELAPFHQQFLPCFRMKGIARLVLLHCGIFDPSMTAMGHPRLIGTLPRSLTCPLCPKSGHSIHAAALSA